MRPSHFMGVGQSIDDIQGDFPHVPVVDPSSRVSVELDVLTQVSVQKLSLDEDFLGGEILEPSVLDLDNVRMVGASHGIQAVQVEADGRVWNDGLESRFLLGSGCCRGKGFGT